MAKKIDMETVQKLRARTGIGLMDCKKALEATDGDIEKAIEELRKKGALLAEKRADKAVQEGIVHAYVHAGNKVGVLVEINCETDFVAKTDDLKNFAQDLALQIVATHPTYVSEKDVDEAFINREKAIYKEQLENQDKPAQVIDKIVAGKMEKQYAEICLLKQPFIKNDKLTIGEVLQELIAKLGENIIIRRFARYEVGQ
jgi:elongation factor Ts